jgi:hypothetical protein
MHGMQLTMNCKGALYSATAYCVVKMDRALPDFVVLASRPGLCTPALAENTVSLAVFRASIELKVGCRRPILGL